MGEYKLAIDSKLSKAGLPLLGRPRAFTLVELIVVVTILAILATVGFASYTSHLSSVRDTTRVNQLSLIRDNIELYRRNKKLPLPTDYIEIKSNGTVIGYQGYAGESVLSDIKLQEGGKDPMDKSYYTYYITKNKKNFQLLGYLEEEPELSFNLLKETKAETVDYEDRYVKVTGDQLGILTESGSNTPVQEVSSLITAGELDIGTTTNLYNAILSDSLTITGSGEAIISGIAINNPSFSYLDSSLVFYYDFKNGSLDDLSNNNLAASLKGDAGFSDIGGVYFPGVNGDYLSLGTPTILSSGLSDFSISVWTKLGVNHGSTSTNYHILGNETYQSFGFEARIEDTTTSSTSGKISLRTSVSSTSSTTIAASNSYPNDKKWHHLVFVKDGTQGRIYLNGQEVSYSSQQSMQNYAASSNEFAIGATRGGGASQSFNGNINNIRVYDRPLGLEEIKILYEKKSN